MRWPSLRPTPRARLEGPFSVTFAGGVYAWPYYCGVAAYLQRHGLVHDQASVFATSSGNVAALALVLGLDAEREVMEATMAANDHHNHHLLGPYLRPAHTRQTFFDHFAPLVPDDGHLRASGRWHVVVTQLAPLLRRRVVGSFASRAALVDTIASSMALPGHSVRLAFDARTAGLGYCLDGALVGGGSEQDPRPGWRTLRVAVWPRLAGLRFRPDLSPSRPLGWRELLTIRTRQARRELFELGRADTERYFGAHS